MQQEPIYTTEWLEPFLNSFELENIHESAEYILSVLKEETIEYSLKMEIIYQVLSEEPVSTWFFFFVKNLKIQVLKKQ